MENLQTTSDADTTRPHTGQSTPTVPTDAPLRQKTLHSPLPARVWLSTVYLWEVIGIRRGRNGKCLVLLQKITGHVGGRLPRQESHVTGVDVADEKFQSVGQAETHLAQPVHVEVGGWASRILLPRNLHSQGIDHYETHLSYKGSGRRRVQSEE